MDAELQTRLTEFVEKIGLLRRDLQHKGDLEKYEGRMARVEQKLSSLAETISRTDPEYAKALRTAWQLPARSLAFRNAEHRKQETQETQETGDRRQETGGRNTETGARRQEELAEERGKGKNGETGDAGGTGEGNE